MRYEPTPFPGEDFVICAVIMAMFVGFHFLFDRVSRIKRK